MKRRRNEDVQIASYNGSPGDVKDSIGNTVGNIVITVYGVRRVLDLLE